MAKSILITGCSSGIGFDAARTLSARGWRVFATCRQDQDCERLQNEGLESFRLDYEDDASIGAAVAEVLERTGGSLNALFNNGAYGIPGLLEDLPTDALRAIFEANLFGYHTLTRKLIPALRVAGDGRIVNCSSVLGFSALKFRGSYVATKYALEGMTDTLRLEMRGAPIKVVLIEPGPITTKIRENSRRHFEKWIDWKASVRAESYAPLRKRLYAEAKPPDPFELPPAAVTKKLIHALESPRPKARYYVTTPTYFLGWANRVLPTSMRDWILSR